MNNEYAQVYGQVQFGPVYHCWTCDEPIARLVPYHEWVPGPTTLDRYADHLAYLNLSLVCTQLHHPARVVVVGPAITSVDWPRYASQAEKVEAIQKAIALLTTELQEKAQSDPLGGFDQPLALALRLHGQAIAPAQGAQEIRQMAGSNQWQP
jgi:hypothetical protein